MIVILSVSLLFGCSDKSVDQAEFPPEKTAAVEVNGSDYSIEKGGYRWVRKKGLETETVTTDHASPNQMAELLKPIRVKPEQKVKVKIEDDPVMKVFLWNETGKEKEIKLEDDQITVPADKGKYIYEVLAEWKNGEISYTSVAEVQ
ncbi:hypothetical protein LIS77_13405 [Cytobacillus firmus]|uniref:hypothetical protein n=1 Tax=Cytobacillus firmus TaxID=1399 RepID=UPI00207A42A3|nr:hypothetical protein [Cytobacillus firmus]USK36942.1 hypothetical protein LIS77_13405 [Cytobacillus firmus]